MNKLWKIDHLVFLIAKANTNTNYESKDRKVGEVGTVKNAINLNH